uniref:Small ribosomal subunit protein bS18c n=1 Tax=Pedobesia claviformis TaxID=2364088 RepID=A0A386B0U9_9CHLO|nr:ribosomal protein S18 [Pedobesia claviformis]AYC65326.1 ribosomal protein S18 [Pedobesia claviformis]
MTKKIIANLKVKNLDYKNVLLLRKFITPEGKILPRRLTKVTAKQHRQICRCIKRARIMSLVPYVRISVL